MLTLELQYMGNDSFERPVYKNGEDLFVDVDPRKSVEPRICTKLNNEFDGEPDTPIDVMKKYKDARVVFFPERVTW